MCAKKNGCTGVERGGTVCEKKERGAIYDVAKSPPYRYSDEKFGHLRVAKKMVLSINFVVQKVILRPTRFVQFLLHQGTRFQAKKFDGGGDLYLSLSGRGAGRPVSYIVGGRRVPD